MKNDFKAAEGFTLLELMVRKAGFEGARLAIVTTGLGDLQTAIHRLT